VGNKLLIRHKRTHNYPLLDKADSNSKAMDMLLEHLVDTLEELVTLLNSAVSTDSPGTIWGNYTRVVSVAAHYQEHPGLFRPTDNGMPPPLTAGTVCEIRWRMIKLL
jgi:hypothetical protein